MMTPREVLSILGLVSQYDNRTVDAEVAKAWHLILGPYEFDDVKAAVIEHFRTSEKWLLPVHLVAGAQEITKARRQREDQEAKLLGVVYRDLEGHHWDADGSWIHPNEVGGRYAHRMTRPDGGDQDPRFIQYRRELGELE